MGSPGPGPGLMMLLCLDFQRRWRVDTHLGQHELWGPGKLQAARTSASEKGVSPGMEPCRRNQRSRWGINGP